MKSFFVLAILMASVLSLLAQTPTPPANPAPTPAPTKPDPISTFQTGTFLGRSYTEIESSGYFGKRLIPTAQRGRFNVPWKLIYMVGLGSNDPYVTEVGYFDNHQAAYFLVAKKTLDSVTTLSEAEVIPLLFKVASGGDWTEFASMPTSGTVPAAPTPAAPATPGKGAAPAPAPSPLLKKPLDYTGDLWQYVHTVGETKLRFFAYRSASKRQLLIYSPLVTPDLSGTDPAPGVLLSFAGGAQLPLTAVSNEPYDVLAVDTPGPSAATLLGNDRPSALKSLAETLAKLPEKIKVFQFSRDDFNKLETLKNAFHLLPHTPDNPAAQEQTNLLDKNELKGPDFLKPPHW